VQTRTALPPVTFPPFDGEQRSLAFTPEQYVIAEDILGNVSTKRISSQRNERKERKNRKLQPIGTELSSFPLNSSFKV